MNLPETGGCLCGKIRHEITETPQLVYMCHRTDCQHMTSSAFSLGVAVPEMSLTPQERQYNILGTVHGGVMATLLASVMGCAVHSTLPARGRVLDCRDQGQLRPANYFGGEFPSGGRPCRSRWSPNSHRGGGRARQHKPPRCPWHVDLSFVRSWLASPRTRAITC
jgi:hypothetical protein